MAEALRRTPMATPVETGEKEHRPQIRLARSTFNRILARFLGRGMLIVLGSVVLLYLIFAATMVRVVPTPSGLVPVKNLTYVGDMVPPGAQVLVNVDGMEGQGYLGRLSQAFIPRKGAAVVEVVAGPYGQLTWAAPDIIAVDGKPAQVPMPAARGGGTPIAGKGFLSGEYLATCISGACIPGEAIIVPRNHMMGTTLSHRSLPSTESGR